MNTILRLLCFTFILSTSFIATSYAQVTSSEMSGKVSGSDNKSLAGATIIAIHQPSGAKYATITNSDGRYIFHGMKPGGPYKVVASFIGYQNENIDNISLQLGDTYTLDLKLRSSSVELSEIAVNGKGDHTFNAGHIGAGTNVSRSQIAALPSISRSINDYIRLTPQVVSTNGGSSFAGMNNRYNSFQIDGTVNNDVFGLSGSGTNGGQASTQPISLEAIDQIQVVVAPFDVRQSGFTGGGINAITKSGTNEFKGSVYAFGNNQDLAGKTAGDIPNSQRTKLSKQSDYQYGLTLGGPIIKDKLFFFINGEKAEKSHPSTYNIGDAVNASNVTQAEADQVVNKIKSLTNGYDGGGYGPKNIDTKSDKLLARIDWNINEKNKFSIRYNYVNASNDVFSRSLSTLNLGDNGYTFVSKTSSLVAELKSTISETLSNELNVAYTGVRDHRQILGTPFPFVSITLSGGRYINLGTEEYSAANYLNQDIYTLTDNLSWLVGEHNFTFGTHNEFFHLKNLFIRDNFGVYKYNSLADFLSVGTAQEALPYEYDYSYSNQQVTGSKSWAPAFSAMQLGFYVQDEWTPSNRLKLTYGLRMDIPVFPDKPSTNTTFNSSAIAQSNGVTNQNMPSSTPLWSPRIGFNWDATGDRSTQLRGGVGLFTGRIPFVWISNSFSNTGNEYIRSQYKSSFPAGFKFNADPTQQLAGIASKTTEIDLIAPHFKFPQVFRANLAVDQKLPFGIKGTLEGIFSKKYNDILYKNLEVKESGSTLNNFDDKRPLYTSNLDPNYTGVIYLGNTSKGYTYNLSAKLEKEFDFGLYLMGAYTYGMSKGINDGTSSQAASSWQYNEQYQGPNNPELSYADFDVRNHFIGAAIYKIEYSRYLSTSIGLFYNGQTGANYSVTYVGDINGDGYKKNDVLFVPTDAQIDQMNFISDKYVTATPDQQKADLKAFLASEPGLKDIRGKYATRNSLHAPFENHFDLRIAQDCNFFTGKAKKTLQLTFDVLNIGNMLDKTWGLAYSPAYSYSILDVKSISALGVPNFQFSKPAQHFVQNDDYSSRWRAQLGIRFSF